MAGCDYCKKKVGIITFNCKCNHKNLCSKCRAPETHNCSFDHKTEERFKLMKANPKIIASKFTEDSEKL